MFAFSRAGASPAAAARAALFAGLVAALPSPALAKGNFTFFNPAGSVDTWCGPVTPLGAIGGSWTDANGNVHGFVRDTDGGISSIDPSGSAYRIVVTGLNDGGTAVGSITDQDQTEHGFVRKPNGTVSTFDAPQSNGITVIAALNAHGTFAGYYMGADDNNHALLVKSDGTFLSYDVPGAKETLALAINDSGATTGEFITIDGGYPVPHGFVRSGKGKFQTFDVRGARETAGVVINGNGVVAGRWYDDQDIEHGFARSTDGTITKFDPIRQTGGTYVTGINDDATVSGFFYDPSSGGYYGFERTADGTLRKFNVKHSGYVLTGGINDSGVIAGSTGGKGFLGTP